MEKKLLLYFMFWTICSIIYLFFEPLPKGFNIKISFKKYALVPEIFAKQWSILPFLTKRPDLITFLSIFQAYF